MDNILFNQLYYIAENCADRYYSKVIETFVSILKCQFANRQLHLINTAQSLKFLEEYADRQAQIWKIFQKHQTIPEDFQDLCKVQPRRALLGYPFHNTAAHMEATPTREGI